MGAKTGGDLDSLFNKSHVAVNTIGWHRMNIRNSDTLKAREYCARGIPFISSGNDMDFAESFKYIYKVPEDDSPIDISGIIKFYKTLKPGNIVNDMRKYAEKNLTWDNQFKKIFDIIQS